MTSLNDLIRRARYFSLAADCSEKAELNSNSRSGYLYKKASEIYEEIARCIDKESPKPLYSKTHKSFSDHLKQPDALTNPEKYLGPNWKDVLNFWIYIDTLSDEEKKEISDRYGALDFNVRDSAIDTAKYAAEGAVCGVFREAVWHAACVVTGIRAGVYVITSPIFSYATWELIGGLNNKFLYDLIMSHKKS